MVREDFFDGFIVYIIVILEDYYVLFFFVLSVVNKVYLIGVSFVFVVEVMVNLFVVEDLKLKIKKCDYNCFVFLLCFFVSKLLI